jgi:hypothetical protein
MKVLRKEGFTDYKGTNNQRDLGLAKINLRQQESYY